MPMTRQERIAVHKKQERLQVKDGFPAASELKEGVPILRSTSEGLVEYVRHNGIAYKKEFTRVDEGVSTEFQLMSSGSGNLVSGASINIEAGDDINIVAGGDTTIHKIITSIDADTYTALSIDLDKTGASTTTNTINGLLIDMDNTTATSGYNIMNGIKCTPTLTHAADAGISFLNGFILTCTGNNAGSSHASINTGMRLETTGADQNNGILMVNDDTGKAYDLRIGSSGDTPFGSPADYFQILTVAAGATTMSTVDDDGAAAHLTIVADGHVEFDGCGVGFDKETAAFSTSPIDSDANDSTDVDFRLGNKYELTLTDDISGLSEFINLIFPATSGNFILVLIQGVADCTVASAGWIAYQSDGSTKALNNAGNDQADGRVRWAGGSAPTLSTAQYDVDIISFYWDADNETAFAVASLDF